MQSKQKGYTLLELGVVGSFFVILLGAVGWVWNVIRIVGYMDVPVDTILVELIVRVIGIFVFPVGCVIGFIPF